MRSCIGVGYIDYSDLSRGSAPVFGGVSADRVWIRLSS